MSNIETIIKDINNLNVFQAIIKADSIINRPQYKNLLCSISGGSDSDIMLDICHKVDKYKKIKYIWFNTGLEYEATKQHIKYLETKYNIDIIKERAIKPIPYTCKKYGQPFLNKYVSEQLSRLQKNNFDFKDKPYEELIKLYPNCISSIKWWCNRYTLENEFEKISRFDIGYNKWLKEFLIKNPPMFKIDNKCCKYAKKEVAKQISKKYNIDMQIIGVRRDEGGIRSTMYKNCFTENENNCQFRPIFYLTNEDKAYYKKYFNLKHSDCYEIYGMKRTGCCGCPYNRKLFEEINIIKKYEHKLYKAIFNIFGDSYEYTKKYKEFYNQMQMKKNQIDGQISLFEI